VRPVVLILGMLAAAFVQTTNGAQRASDEGVWRWSAECGAPTTIVEVRFGKRTIHRQAVALCRTNAQSGAGNFSGYAISFGFRPNRAITWEGYRDRPDRTPANVVLNVDLWEAGGETNAVLMGISVMTADRILMNTVHIVHPGRRDETTVARGLVVRTYSIAAGQRR